MSGFKEVRKRGSAPGVKYPNQHQTLLEMGFDSLSIVEALDKSEGNLESATALLLGEPAAASVVAPKVAVAPMKLVGKQPATAKTVVKPDIKEIHNKFMQTYKVNKCKEKGHHDKRMCVFYHTDGDRRRNPFQILYNCVECPNTTETTKCPDGDSCLKAHNMLERMFHPELFKISYCQRSLNGQTCDRGNVCAFAHNEEDHRIPMSQTLAKQSAGTAVSSSNAVETSQVPAPSGGPDPMHISKTMTDSRQLDGIQDKLIRLIKSTGLEGIISSELPKRYYDVYNERLELTDEAGEKFRIKDLLLAHPAVHVKMHKGVQPKYVYEEVPAAPVAPVAAPSASKQSASVAPVSVPAGTPLSYAALAAGSKAKNAPVTEPVAAPAPEIVATKSTRRRGPSESDISAAPITAIAPAAVDAASAFGFASTMDYSVPSPVAPVAPAVGSRRRGPDAAPAAPEAAAVNTSSAEVASLRQQIATLQSTLDAKTAEVIRLHEVSEELRKRDAQVAQLRQDKAAELAQFRHNIGLIETALVETQRQESVYINEIPLHDTINKSSRARDDLTKFVSVLKMQLQSRIAANESANVTKSTLSNFLLSNGINGNLGSSNGSSSIAPAEVLVSPAVPEPPHHHGTLMCSLPGCSLEGSFICSACGKAGYCGADHQREHWASHINECSL